MFTRHIKVDMKNIAYTKAGVAFAETIASLCGPGGVAIALGLVTIEYFFGDTIYQQIDPTYNVQQ